MKKLFYLIIAVAITIEFYGQPCLPDGITFSTQSQIDSFPINHPGCTEIEGWVRIGGNDITNLNGLNMITAMGSNFSIGYTTIGNPRLTDISGLQNLGSIEGGLMINRNDSLVSLIGLENLTSIGGDLSITTNNRLPDLDELSGLTEIPLGFYLFGNAALKDLTGLHNIISVGDDFYIQLTKLTDLTGFESLTTISGNMNISYNDSLVNMEGFTNLTTIHETFWFEFNQSLISLEGLESLTYVDFFRINSNENLESLSGIQNIDPESLESFKIRNNDKLSYCAVESVCQHLLNPDENTDIIFNTTGCNSIEEVLEECSVSTNDVNLDQRVKTYPNPFSTQVSFEYHHQSASKVTVTIFNSFGKQVKLIEAHQPAGIQTISWDAEGMPSGIYSFTLLVDEKMVRGKIILVD